MGVCSLLHHRDFKSQSHRGYRGAQRRSDVAVQRCSLQPSPCNFQPSCASSPRAPTIAPLPVRAQRRSDVAVQRCSLQPSPCNFQSSCASSPRAPTIAPLPVRAQRRCAPTSSYDPAPLASRLSRSLPRASLAPCLAPRPSRLAPQTNRYYSRSC